MFNLTVETAHTFYVGENGWLVHNGCPTLNNYNLAKSDKLQDVLKTVQETGRRPSGYDGGGIFKNRGLNGEYKLPELDNLGRPITYREYDVNPKVPGVNRGEERLIIGSDGRAYSTSDHYKTYAPANFSGKF